MSVIETSSTRIGRKRMSLREVIILKKRRTEDEDDFNHFDSVEDALNFFSSIFPCSGFKEHMRPIILQQLLYGVITNKTQVDKELEDLRRAGRVRFLKLGGESSELIGIMLMADFREMVNGYCDMIDLRLLETFLNFVSIETPSISLDQEMLKERFSDDEVTELLRAGLLTVRDVGTWWVSVPFIGVFMKAYKKGKHALTMIFKRSRFQEISITDLEKKKFGSKLGVKYHMYDFIGSDLIDRVMTTTGIVLRAKPSCFETP